MGIDQPQRRNVVEFRRESSCGRDSFSGSGGGAAVDVASFHGRVSGVVQNGHLKSAKNKATSAIGQRRIG